MFTHACENLSECWDDKRNDRALMENKYLEQAFACRSCSVTGTR